MHPLTRPCTQEDQLGAPTLSSIRALDLSALRIRDTGAAFACTPPTPFFSLVELTLDGNQLGPAALPALAGLTSLAVLRLNSNRLGERRGGGGGGGAAGGGGGSVTAGCGGSAAGSSSGCGVTKDGGAEGKAGGDACSRNSGSSDGGPVVENVAAAAAACATRAARVGWQLPSLRVLELRGNALTALGPLQLAAWAPGMRRLDVAGNELTRIDGLEGLARLRELVVSQNKLRCVHLCVCVGGPPQG
jgi:hypothetical protein